MLRLHLESNDTFSVNLFAIVDKLEFLNWKKCQVRSHDYEICGEYTRTNFPEIDSLFFKEISPMHSGVYLKFLDEWNNELVSFNIETKFCDQVLIRLDQHLRIDSEKPVALNIIKDLIVTLPAVRVSYIDHSMIDDMYDKRWDKWKGSDGMIHGTATFLTYFHPRWVDRIGKEKILAATPVYNIEVLENGWILIQATENIEDYQWPKAVEKLNELEMLNDYLYSIRPYGEERMRYIDLDENMLKSKKITREMLVESL